VSPLVLSLASRGYSPELAKVDRKKKRRWDLHCRARGRDYFEHAKRLQGLPADFDLPGFTVTEKKIRALGNAVPLPLGRAVAGAVKRAIYGESGRPVA